MASETSRLEPDSSFDPMQAANDPVADAQALLALPAGPMLEVFERLAIRWGLDRTERLALLGVRSPTTLGRWLADPAAARLDLVTRERLGHVFAIQAAAVTLLGPGPAADGWVKRPHAGAMFGGRAPIAYMTSGLTGALADVRDYLDERSRS